MKRAHPQTQTHFGMAKKLKWLIDDPHRVAMNMDALTKRGQLELDREGWDGMPNTKRYRVSPDMLDQLP
jgi:hypothetical protein